jgi:glyoxylase-like metal-dependent hydrolase (beta-lactamase superfamily II)
MSIQAGRWRIDLLTDGTFRLDGGAMFGIVPKVIWQRLITPDDLNRIELGLNSLLVRDGTRTIVVETGMGTKWSEKDKQLYVLKQEPGLVGMLAQHGVQPADVTHVLFSHLHLDHAGGNTRFDESGSAVPTFPNARYMVPRGEWEEGINPDEITRHSFTPEDLIPIRDAGLVDFLPEEGEALPGVRVMPTPGHTPHHVSLLFGEGTDAVLFAGDIFPTSMHIKPHYHMGYDLDAKTVAATRVWLAEECIRHGWRVFFPHEPRPGLCRLAMQDGKLMAVNAGQGVEP